MGKKDKQTRSEALAAMRESAPEVGTPEVTETKAAKKKRLAAEKKEAKKIELAANKAAEKEAKAAEKAQKKLEREAKAAANKAEREAKKAARPPKTGHLSLEQFTAIKGETLLPLKEPTEDQKDKMADAGFKVLCSLDGKLKQATIVLHEFAQWSLWERVVNPQTGLKDFKSLRQLATVAMPISASQGHRIVSNIAALGPHIPIEDLAEMPARNQKVLIDNPTIDLKDPDIIKAAKGSKRGLVRKVQEKNPGLHLEEDRAIIVPQSVKTKHDEAIAAITALHELDTKEEAEEALAEYFMQGQTENPNFAGMSNREAFESWNQAQNAGALADVVAEPFEGEEEPQSDEVAAE